MKYLITKTVVSTVIVEAEDEEAAYEVLSTRYNEIVWIAQEEEHEFEEYKE